MLQRNNEWCMFSNAAQNDKKAVKYKTLTRVYLYICLEWNPAMQQANSTFHFYCW